MRKNITEIRSIELKRPTPKSKIKFFCSKRRPCKRMVCDKCVRGRREFFIESGIYHSKWKQLNTHLVLSWGYIKEVEEKWVKLADDMRRLSKAVSGRNKGYIRVISVGPNECPHVHFLVNDQTALKIERAFKELFQSPQNNSFKEPAYDVPNLLGYFFDQNFLKAFNDPRRVKGIRLISASRGMPCGFPSKRLEELLTVKQYLVANGVYFGK